MYSKKIEEILLDLENKDIHLAGGSTVGMVLSIVNSLIKYISNLTLGKKKYSEVQEDIKEILIEAENLKCKSLQVIDKDVEVLENLLAAYKERKENYERYDLKNRQAVNFCLDVTKIALDTLILSERISKVGNKMLASDFKICAYYAFASVEASIVNIKINLDALEDESYKKEIESNYTKIYARAQDIKEEILKW